MPWNAGNRALSSKSNNQHFNPKSTQTNRRLIMSRTTTNVDPTGPILSVITICAILFGTAMVAKNNGYQSKTQPLPAVKSFVAYKPTK